MDEMTIGELANEAGTQASTLRYYESFGIMPQARRVSGQRRYSQDDLKYLAIIQVAKEAGFTLAEIRTLLTGFSDEVVPSARWKKLAREKLPQVDELISLAHGMKRLLEEGLECECLSIDACLVLAAQED